jgi:orotate phosphoribosyltransferase
MSGMASIAYRSIADLNADIVHWACSIPEDVDLIAGIPRSGLLAANLLALHLNKPLTDLDGLLAGRILASGGRFAQDRTAELRDGRLKVLVVDDSVNSGGALRRAQQKISDSSLGNEIILGAVYIRPGTESYVDTYARIVEGPRMFEWNIMHHDYLSHACMGLEGVLCRLDHAYTFDAAGLREALHKATPLVRPTRTIGCIIARVPEGARATVEAWLSRHGIAFERLVMLGTEGTNGEAEKSALTGKIAVYRDEDYFIFFERDPVHAREIAAATGKSVFCTSDRRMIQPGRVSRGRARFRRLSRKLLTMPGSIAGWF